LRPFNSKPENKPQVNHLKGKMIIVQKVLEWKTTSKENINHAWIGLCTAKKKRRKHNLSKLTEKKF
jgi:hypothetical protein